jgi:hypothetical protein
MAFSKYVSDVVVFHLRMARRGRNMLLTERIKVTPINSQLRSLVYLRGIRNVEFVCYWSTYIQAQLIRLRCQEVIR